MARITVEDCIDKVSNRFELVMLAAQRARDLSAGAPLTVERDNDKDPVVALREIAAETVDLDHLRYELIHNLRRYVPREEEEGPSEAAAELAAQSVETGGTGPVLEGLYADQNVEEEETRIEGDEGKEVAHEHSQMQDPDEGIPADSGTTSDDPNAI